MQAPSPLHALADRMIGMCRLETASCSCSTCRSAVALPGSMSKRVADD